MVFPPRQFKVICSCWWGENLLLAGLVSLESCHVCQAWQQAAFAALVREQVAYGSGVWHVGHVFHDPAGIGFCSAVYEFLEGNVLRDDLVEDIDSDWDELSLSEPDWIAVLIEDVGVFGHRVGEAVRGCVNISERHCGEAGIRCAAHDVGIAGGAASAEAAAIEGIEPLSHSRQPYRWWCRSLPGPSSWGLIGRKATEWGWQW